MLYAPNPFGDGLAEQQHPLGHVLLVVGDELQRGALRQDDLEGVGPLRAVGAPAASTVLSSARQYISK